MKKLFFIMFFLVTSSLMYSANVYFLNDGPGYIYTNGQTFNSASWGAAPMAYHLWVDPARYMVDVWSARFQDPDGNWSDWSALQSSYGLHQCFKAGTWHVQGRVHVTYNVYGGYDYWMYTSFTLYSYVVDNYAPAVPSNAQVSFPLNSNPVITWNANTEMDLSGYRVYKKYTDSYGVVLYNGSTDIITSTSYTDGVFSANYKTGTDVAEYWVKAEDINNNVSVETSHFSGDGTSLIQQKIAYKSDEEIPDIFYLDQNYPNPFNPSTNISYSLPQAGLINLKIFDLLGNEVAELVNEVKEKGNYRVQFNGENLSSGVYIYTIRFNNFIESKRMILIK